LIIIETLKQTMYEVCHSLGQPSSLAVGDFENIAMRPRTRNMRIAAVLLHSKVKISPQGKEEMLLQIFEIERDISDDKQ
jgi:hypothetical protein